MSLNDHFSLPLPLLSVRICEVIAVWKCASDEAGMIEPLESTADCKAADVVWLSL